MVDYVKVNNGAWDQASSWDIGTGFPSSSADTATLGAFDTSIPQGVSITCGAITLTGTSDAARSRLLCAGSLAITANMTLNAWNELNLSAGATLELNGNDVVLTSNTAGHNRLVFKGAANNRVRVTSSVVGVGRIWRVSASIRCHIDIDYVDFVDIAGLGGTNQSQGIGANYTFATGDFVRVQNFTFTGCRESSFGGFNHVDATQEIMFGDVRQGRNVDTYALYITDNFTTSLGTGSNIVRDLTFDTTIASRSLRITSSRLQAVDTCVFKDAPFYFVTESGHNVNLTNSFSFVGDVPYGPTEIAIGASGECISTYVINERNNPKPFNALFNVITQPLIELTWQQAYNDDGDLFILRPDYPTTLTYGLVIDQRSCALFNALGSAMADVYNGDHNTMVGNYDAAYGSLCRTESGGTFTGTLNMSSNIVYNKTPVAGSLGFNFDAATPPLDMVTYMDNNCWYQIDIPYKGVTSATKTPGVTVGYGGNDISLDPQFFDATRNAAQYDLLQGTGVGTTAAFLADMLNINGYDAATKTQIPANASPRRPIDALNWVRAGFAPTNQAFQNAGHDGITIGAVEYVSGSVTLQIQPSAQSQLSSNIDLLQQNSLTVDKSLQLQSSGNITLIQQNILNVLSSLQANISGNIDLLQQNTLTINGSVQLQSSSNIDLLQQSVLNISTSTQDQLSSNVVLEVGVTISVDESVQDHVSNNLVLSEQAVLTIVKAAQDQSSQNIDLTQSHVLTIDASGQLQIAEIITLDVPSSAVGYLTAIITITPSLTAEIDTLPRS